MEDSSWRIRDSGSGIDIRLHIQPKAACDELAGLHNGAIKLRISAPPADNAANRAVVEFFSALLKVPKSRITFLRGQKSRDKILRITGITLEDVTNRLP